MRVKSEVGRAGVEEKNEESLRAVMKTRFHW